MAVVAETQRAVTVLQGLQGRLVAAGDPELGEKVAAMIDLLASPNFRHLLNLQQSVRQLKHHLETGPPVQSVEDYSFNPNGELVLPEPESDSEPELPDRSSVRPLHPYAFENKMFEGDEEPHIKRTETVPAASAPGHREDEEDEEEEEEEQGNDLTRPTRSIPLEKANEDLEQALRELALGREVLSIELMKQEGRGLGFSVVGLKSENQGELGIFVQQIQRSGVAAKDNRLRESDQILAINGALVDSSVSHKQAIGMLQKVKDKVNLIVARGVLHIPTQTTPDVSPTEPDHTRDDAGQVPQMTMEEPEVAPAQAGVAVAAAAAAVAVEEPFILMNDELNVHADAPGELEDTATMAPDIEVIDLYNQGSGLGFGIVGVRDIGIVVKTIVAGGAAEKDGRLQSGDIILRIGGTDLDGMNSDQVASVLRQSGRHVQLVVARGPLSVVQPPTVPREDEEDEEDEENVEEEEEGDDDDDEEEEEQEEQDERRPPQGLDLVQGQMELEPLPVSPPPISLEHAGIESGNLFEVELVKGSQGLGLSIAGFIKNTPDGGETSGIFVKKMAEGSAAALNGNIRVGDQIIAVDGVNVRDFDNKAAVNLLRQTGAVVHLRLARFPPEEPSKLEPYVQAQAALLPDLTSPLQTDRGTPAMLEDDEMPAASSPFLPLDGAVGPGRLPEDSFEGELSTEDEIAIMATWQGLLGMDRDIVIAQLSKFHEGGSLGISLEGTVDIDEDGQEVQPHHYIRSVLPEGPVGQNGQLSSGDELLEVNRMRLLGLNHEEVVKILKDLPQHVRLVCARHSAPVSPDAMLSDESFLNLELPGVSYDDGDDDLLRDISQASIELPEVEADKSTNVSSEVEMTTPMLPALDDSESAQDSSAQSDTNPSKDSSMWSDEIQYIELIKGERGLGFSILDYQDPDNPAASVLVIRSLVPGGVAEQDGRLIPGDRLVSVNDATLADCSLDTAVQVLKGAPIGLVQIGVAKPVTEGEEVVIASPVTAEEAPSPYTSPPPFTTTPMLPDVDISPLAAAVMAREAAEDTEGEIISEVEVDGQAELVEPSLQATEVAPVQSDPALLIQQDHRQHSASPPDLVTSIAVSDGNRPALGSQQVAEIEEIEQPNAPSTPPQPKRTPPKPPPKPILRSSRSSSSSTTSGYGLKGNAPISTSRISPVSPHRQASVERLPMMPARATPPGRRKSGVVLPSNLEETIVLKKTNAGLGLTVSADKCNGVVIKSIIRGGCVQQDGRLAVGDYITAVNGENMRNLNNNTARGVLRRTFLQGTDITVTYIASSKAAELSDSASSTSDCPLETPSLMAPPPVNIAQAPDSPAITPASSQEVVQTPATEESQWGDVSTVVVNKEVGRSLGISIVGGRSGDGQSVQGIYIKHVLEDSPAGRTGQLKTGDRILEVNGCDLREATHDQAVAVIRNASNPMRFQVQSLTDGSPVAIVQDEGEQELVVAVAATVVQTGLDETDCSLDRVPEGAEAQTESDSESEDEFGYTWKKVSDRYKDLEGELHVIELTKGDRGLGLSLAGNKDRSKINVFVVGVNPLGAAGKDGRVLIGDEILEINGVKVYGHSHQNASIIIQGLAPGTIKLIILRNQGAIDQLAVPPVIFPNQTSIHTVLKKQQALDEPDSADSPDAGVAPATGGEERRPAPTPTPADYPNVQTITLMKGPRGLGFAIYENRDEQGLSGIFVKDVTMGGPAAKEGHLRVGDQILAVNDKSVIGLSKLSAISVLKDTRGSVLLTISSSKPFPATHSSHSLFPTLDRGAATSQPDVSVGALKMPSGRGNFFPALDLDDDPKSVHDSAVLDSFPFQDEGTRMRSDAMPLDPLTCPVVKGQSTLLVIDKGDKKGLGISIIGGTDKRQSAIMIQAIQKDSVIDKDGRLQTGDLILEVDGFELKNVTHEDALNVLRQTTSKVRIVVLREDPPPYTSPTPEETPGAEEADVFTVVLHQPASQSLGLSIVGKAGALYISDIISGSIADSNGRLMKGDQIVSVNGLNVQNIPQEALATLRKNAEGDVSLEISRQRGGAGSPPSMSSYETVVSALPVIAEHAESSTGSEGAAAAAAPSPGDARVAFIQQQESFGSSTEMPPEQTSISSASVKTIVLERGAEGLGFSIVGGYGSPHGDLPIYIKTVFSRGAAAEAKQLKRGDQILAVNNESLEGATHQMAVGLLKKARGQVTLTVVS